MYTLTWETESYYPITEFLIRYRKTHLGGWQVSFLVLRDVRRADSSGGNYLELSVSFFPFLLPLIG